MGKIIDISGLKVGRLTVIRMNSPGVNGRPDWLCICECGNDAIVKGVMLRTGKTKSCGCLKKERMHEGLGKTHGMTRTRTYKSWSSMVARCNNKADPSFPRYGAVGITVCEDWLRFEAFFSDMGVRPEGMTLDRVDGTQGYFPANCRWATHAEQQNNIKSNRRIDYMGNSVTARELSVLTGACYSKLRSNIFRLGMGAESAVSKILSGGLS